MKLKEAIIFFLSLWDSTTGGFRFAPHQPATLMATAYVVLGLEFAGGLSHLSEAQESSIISFLLAGVQPDGHFRDPLFQPQDILSDEHDLTYFHEETSAFCQHALDALLAAPPPPRDWPAEWCADDGLTKHFESFLWQNAWLDSNRVMFILSQLCHDAERHGKPELLGLVDVALDWLDAHQSPVTGLWQGPHEVLLTNAMAATFHFTFYYSYRRRQLKYVDRIIDSCLALQQRHGLFSDREIGHTCLDYDALDLLAKASLATDYRSNEVQGAMNRAYDALLGLYNPENGGFCHCKERLGIPGREPKAARLLRRLKLSGFVPSPARIPFEKEYHVCWRLLSCSTVESNAFSTWFRLLALQLAKQKEWLYVSPSERPTFRRLPFLGYHDPLAIQSAHGIVTTVPLVKENWRRSKRERVELHHNSLISVIIPAYNAECTLSSTLASLRAQTYPYWEAIIVNDGSSDRTNEIAHRWARSDPRIKVIDQSNTGLGGARNAALAVARGKFVHCLDADDLIEPDFYVYMIQALSRVPSNALSGHCAVSGFQQFSGAGRILGTRLVADVDDFQFPRLVQGNPGPPATYFFERAILDLTGAFDETLRHCHDWDLWLRFSRIGVGFIPVSRQFVAYRIRKGSLSQHYDSFLNSASMLLQRATKEDIRCALVRSQALPLPEEIIDRAIVKFWLINIKRAACLGAEDQIAKLFAWAKRNLPQHSWNTLMNYRPDLDFRWIEAGPEPRKEVGSEIERRLFYLDALNRLWPSPLPKMIVKRQFKGIISLLISSTEFFNLKRRVGLITILVSMRKRQGLGLNECLYLSGVALVKKLRSLGVRLV